MNPGAISTIIDMLGKPQTKCVAITMLGKTVELCADDMVGRTDVNQQNELASILSTVMSNNF